MDKQQFDHIENRIRQAADEISVSFNEQAWNRMEIKLDNEFNKDRRRGVIWWWFSFMLLGIAALGIYLYHYKPADSSNKITNNLSSSNNTPSNKKANPAIEELKKVTDNRPDEINTKANPTGIPETQKDLKNKKSDLPTAASETAAITELNNKRNKKLHLGKVEVSEEASSQRNKVRRSFSLVNSQKSLESIPRTENRKSITKSKIDKSATDRQLEPSGLIVKNNDVKTGHSRKNNIAGNNHNDTGNNVIADNSNNTTPANTNNTPIVTAQPSDSSTSNVSKNDTKTVDPVIKADSIKSVDSVTSKKTQVKLTPSSSKGFYFLASGAADATGIKSISIKDTKPTYGIGVGYRFNKKLSVQTGFYFGKKVYYAGADDYKTQPGSFIAKIISAEAECYIYDIPLTLRYDIFHRANSNLYATAGLSSFILKRETYDIHFFNPMGSYRHMSYTYTHNVNYLSVLNFSLGYEHKVSNSLYLQAEPYIKLPLAGVGEGSVRLYSAGLQIGIKYQPIKKKK